VDFTFTEEELSGPTLTFYVYGETIGSANLQLRIDGDNGGIREKGTDQWPINFWEGKSDKIVKFELNQTTIDHIKATSTKKVFLYGDSIVLRAVAKSEEALKRDPFNTLEKVNVFTVGKENISEAEALADANSDINLFIIFIMADSGEEYISLEKSVGDRYDMDAWHDGNDLVNAIVAKKKEGQKILVVINAPGPINVPWKDKVDAIVFSGMGGAESGNGLVDVLFGDLNPSGHLPYVWGTIDQYPASIDLFGNPSEYDYNEGLFVGQRWFDLKGYAPIWPFGYGLSYTSFSFSDLSVSINDDGLTATFNVKNTGDYDGDVVPMLFLKFPDSVASNSENGEYPSKLFKGFEKVFVKAGETKTVTITVDEHALSYYSVSKSAFVLPSGTFTVYIGHNARDFVIQTDFTIS
jgi:beta-glucosidase